MPAIVQRRLLDVVLRLPLAVGHVEEAPHGGLAEQALPGGGVVAAGFESLAVDCQPLGDPRVRHARHHHRQALAPAFFERLDGDHAAPEGRMRLLHRPRPHGGQAHREELALVDERLLGPGANEHRGRLVHPLVAVVAAQAVADVLVLVVAGAAADAHFQAPAAQIVEDGELDGQTHRMMKRHLDDREAHARARGARGQRAGERDRIGVGALAGEVVLGEPQVVEAHRFGEHALLELLVDAREVVLGRRRERQRHPAELHARRSRRTRAVAAWSTTGGSPVNATP